MANSLKSHLPLFVLLLATIISTVIYFAFPSEEDLLLENALQSSGKNRRELEKVLEHYSHDKEKRRAAEFLIRNMPGHFSYTGDEVDSLKVALTQYDPNEGYDEEHFGYLKNFPYHKLKKVYDIEHIRADFLIENIDHSFKVWKESRWGKYLSEEDFYELILPYRLGNERLTNWKKDLHQRFGSVLDSLYQGDDPIVACDSMYRYVSGFMNWKYCDELNGPDMDADFLIREQTGDCRAVSAFTTYIMRSVGIPVSMDLYIYSTELANLHCWNAVKGNAGKVSPFTLGEVKPSHSGRLFRKLGKVYRNTFAMNTSILQKSGMNRLPSSLANIHWEDVTDNYHPSNEVKVDCSFAKDEDIQEVFLGVFSINGWVAIGMADSHKGSTAVFKNIESDNVYIPLYLKGDRLNPAGFPFRLDSKKQEVISYEPTEKRMEQMVVERKYPLTKGIDSYMKRMTNGRFEAANNKEFKNATILYQLDEKVWPKRVINEQSINNPRPFRYVRYISADKYSGDIAEVAWYGKNGEKLEGKLLGTPAYRDLSECALSNAVDGNTLTFFSSADFPGWVGLDLGSEKVIGGITYSPRNDDNFIRKGDEYELFYFSAYGWMSLGKQTGTSSAKLVYKDVPANAIYWLRNLTRGKEEQIFTYENEKQCFNYERGRKP